MPRTTRSFNLNTVAAPSRASYPVYPPRQALLALYDSVSVKTLDNTQKVVRKAPDLLAFLSACLVFGGYLSKSSYSDVDINALKQLELMVEKTDGTD